MMLKSFRQPGYWFAPKRFGYGASLPIAWQGWVVYLGYIAFVIGLVSLARAHPGWWLVLGVPLVIAATAWLLVVTRRRTRGGWRWRWGSDD